MAIATSAVVHRVDGASLPSLPAVSNRRPASGLPPVARRLLHAIERGRLGALLPPRIDEAIDPLGVRRWVDAGALSGPVDAQWLGVLWSQNRFRPFLDLLERLDAWRRTTATGYRDVLPSRLLDLSNVELYSPLVTESFLRCIAGGGDAADDLCRRRRSFQMAMSLFLRRLRRDRRNGSFRRNGFHGSIVGLSAHSDETHNLQQRVLRLRFRNGACLAYKPRPANGELIFLSASNGQSPASLFDVLNRLPPVAGSTRLPVLRIWAGSGRDRHDYLWQEWVQPPKRLRRIAGHGGMALRGPCLPAAQAAKFWHAAGALSAACFAFGIGDQFAGNLVIGHSMDCAEPRPYPVDAEVCLHPLPGLRETSLVNDVANTGNPHVGFECAPSWSSPEQPRAGFFKAPDGSVELRRITGNWARTMSANLVADRRGNIGYAAYLADFLRGMFDQWASLCVHRERWRKTCERVFSKAWIRVLMRPTDVYTAELDRRLFGVAPLEDETWHQAEIRQLREGDVPYFVRSAAGGEVLYLVDEAHSRRWVELRSDIGAGLLNPAAIQERIGFVDLGVVLRDAVAHVFGELGPARIDAPKRGVTIQIHGAHRGMAMFDWPQREHRLVFQWDGDQLKLSAEPMVDGSLRRQTVAQPSLRRQLLRIDRMDAALRARWAEEGFQRGVLQQQIKQLCDAAAEWLRDVLAEHGWPGRRLVGARASDAAGRLVQHLDGQVPFQRRCLRLLRAAAERGDAAWSQVAQLHDTIQVNMGKPQFYGSKLQRRDGALQPYPIRAPDQVDQRRARYGMDSMADYLRRAARVFGDTDGHSGPNGHGTPESVPGNGIGAGSRQRGRTRRVSDAAGVPHS